MTNANLLVATHLTEKCKYLVLLRIPKPQPNPRVQIRKFFAAVSDGFGSFVRESIFTYQVAAFKRRCVTTLCYAEARRTKIDETQRF